MRGGVLVEYLLVSLILFFSLAAAMLMLSNSLAGQAVRAAPAYDGVAGMGPCGGLLSNEECL